MDWQPKEGFEKGQYVRVIAWLTTDKGFEDITTELYYTDGCEFDKKGWYWSESEELVKKPRFILGVIPYPEPPVLKSPDVQEDTP